MFLYLIEFFRFYNRYGHSIIEDHVHFNSIVLLNKYTRADNIIDIMYTVMYNIILLCCTCTWIRFRALFDRRINPATPMYCNI